MHVLNHLFRAAWRSRGFIASSVQREFSARYRNSLLGAAWAVINPLAMVAVYMLIFSQLMQARLPGSSNTIDYGIYLCAGILSWGLFAEIIQRSTTVFLDHADLIRKMNFPRICLPLIVLANAGVNFAIIFGLFLLVLLASGNFPGVYLLALLPVIAILGVLALGLGILAGILNVFFRDAGQFFGILLQFWFWFTPIVYPLSILPEGVVPFVAANPLTPLIASQQAIALGSGWPDWGALFAPALAALVVVVLALALFRRRADEIVDEL
jgi:lipopolysaccharide transport system permease protein